MKNIKQYPHDNQLGFTLLELMVTLTLIIIALSLATPSFNNSNIRSDLRVATHTVSQTLQLARQLAISHNTVSTITFSTDTAIISLLNDSNYKKYVYFPSKTQTTVSPTLNFLPTGVINEGNSTFTVSSLKNSNMSTVVSYSIMGFVTDITNNY